MSKLEKIKADIDTLTLEEKAELAHWLHGWEDDDWDRQMAEDVAAGKLDAVLEEVDEDIAANRLQDMP